ncbi:carboxypeptidase regulatory-like domain-containing protein [Halomonas binhaiensis]|uniref:Carboxypeptidase regulatory-like domain-containing protein n=1 Tax=Halomonas binhaiensis TaxID=2562282 RepID=A0A5C1ND56_9GAMM|nr:carboxypeptidase regulatory-like domain-containing protein [Halomonas binhaiensis]QEM81612.1 hypothetical protein E4T21_08690 [Halomonas binhaiensis]
MTQLSSRYLPLTALATLAIALAGCQSIIPTDRGQGPDVVDIGQTEPSQPPPAEKPTTPPPVQRVSRTVAFDPAVYAQLPKTGSAVVTGRLTLNTSNGVVIGSQQGVSVAPVTPYSAEAVEQALAGKTVERADPRAQEYTHSTRTNANGYFILSNLPPGNFYVSGIVENPSTGEREIIIKEATLSNDRTTEVELTR